MLRTATKIVLVLALAVTPVLIAPRPANAQTSAEQRAYQAGFQNGVNDRNQNKPLNLRTDNWKGQNLTAYQRGYEDGYRGRGGQYGYNNRYGYGHDVDHDRDDQARGGWNGNGGYVGNPEGYNTDAERRAYQAGFQNGQNDRSQNKPLNLRTDNWKGQNLTAYQRGYEDGYRGRYRH
jgi:ribosome modulation factor